MMLRSASFAALEMLRVCCRCPRCSSPSRVTLRIHDEHCGSSDGLASDAIGSVVVLESADGQKKSTPVAGDLQIWHSLRTRP